MVGWPTRNIQIIYKPSTTRLLELVVSNGTNQHSQSKIFVTVKAITKRKNRLKKAKAT